RGVCTNVEPVNRASAHDMTIANHQSMRASFPEQSVGALGSLDQLARGFRSHRHVTSNGSALADRSRVREYPVEVAILAAILDQPGPRVASLQGRPQVGERLSGHVRMPHDVVRLVHQLCLAEARRLDEIVVDVRYPSLRVGLGHDRHTIAQDIFALSNGQVATHPILRKPKRCWRRAQRTPKLEKALDWSV